MACRDNSGYTAVSNQMIHYLCTCRLGKEAYTSHRYAYVQTSNNKSQTLCDPTRMLTTMTCQSDSNVLRGLFRFINFFLKDAISALIVSENAGLDDGSSVVLLAANEPPDYSGKNDCGQEDDGVIHIIAGDWSNSWEEEDDGDKRSPDDGPNIDDFTVFAHMPRAWFEFVEHDLADNWDAIRPIKTNSTDVEYAKNGCVASQSNQVEGNAPENSDPNGIQWDSGTGLNLDPQFGSWNQSIAAECKKSSSQGLGCREADELQDDKGANCEE